MAEGGKHVMMSLDVLRQTIPPKKGDHYSQAGDGALMEVTVHLEPQDFRTLQLVAAWRSGDLSIAVKKLCRDWAISPDGQEILARGATLTTKQLAEAIGDA